MVIRPVATRADKIRLTAVQMGRFSGNREAPRLYLVPKLHLGTALFRWVLRVGEMQHSKRTHSPPQKSPPKVRHSQVQLGNEERDIVLKHLRTRENNI